MKIDYITGNPPYHYEYSKNITQTGNNPLYHLFMDNAYLVCDKVIIISPARFLFDAGKTPKEWNQKILNSPYFHVVKYYTNSKDIFPDILLRGGIAITFYNKDRVSEPIGIYIMDDILRSIKEKVTSRMKNALSEHIYAKGYYYFSDKLKEEHPEVGYSYISSNVFAKYPYIFSDEEFENSCVVYGRLDNKRISRYISRKYVKYVNGLEKYKVIIPGANGNGDFGEILGNPFVAEPYAIGTQTFIGIGFFSLKEDADACLKYIKTKFVRCLMSILKVTHDTSSRVFSYVPMQDFTINSDIDWNLDIKELDKVLYRKYDFTEDEINFIERNVRSML